MFSIEPYRLLGLLLQVELIQYFGIVSLNYIYLFNLQKKD